MAQRNTSRILIWIIVILVATNLSMGISFWMHRHPEEVAPVSGPAAQPEIPGEQRTRFFREQLDLTPEQLPVFRELNREFNRSAHRKTAELEQLRIEMVEELAKDAPSDERLDSIAQAIGNHHAELKKITMDYFLGLKAECTRSQQKKLQEIFLSASKSEEEISLPARGRGYKGGSAK